MDPNGLLLEAVVVEKVLELPPAVGKRPQLGTGELFRVVHEIAHLGTQGLHTVGPCKRLQAFLPPPARRDRGHDVAEHLLRDAYVGAHHLEEHVVGLVVREDADRRDSHPLLVDLHVVARISARHPSADVRLVSDGGRESEQLPSRKIGLKT